VNAPAPVSARLHDAAVLLPCVGLLLLMPPFIGLISPRLTLLGIPLLVFYVFGGWAVLIVLTAVLARRLDPPEPARDADPSDLPPA
jgi:NADH:ubiquinone oxidoreductase subunit 5 (subunit L)/multisubunit Na+/H+ antiporter MnhA subunit